MYFQVSSAPFGYVPRSIWSGVLNQNINLLSVIKQFNASTKFPALTDGIYTILSQTVWKNQLGCVIQGQLDIPLSQNGVQQAKLLAKSINNVKWSEVWTSDLKRSWQTANFLFNVEKQSELNDDTLLIKPLPSIQTDKRVRERHYGTAQGQSSASLQKLASEAGMKVTSFVPPEAESPAEVRDRAISFFKDLCSRQLLLKDEKDPSILLVGHGGWLREFMTYLASLEQATFSQHEKDAVHRLTPNTAVSQFIIQLRSDGEISSVRCLSIHNNSHLVNPNECNELAL